MAATDSRELIDDVRAALAKETNAEAAREEIRAVGMIGGVKELDALLAASKKFDSRLDGAVWKSFARGGGPDAVDAIITRRDLRLLPFALFGHPETIAATASRVLATSNAELWDAWLGLQSAADIALDTAVAARALTSGNAPIARATAWHLATDYIDWPPADPKPILDALDKWHDDGYARELLSRALGRPPHESEESLAWLATEGAHSWRLYAAARLMTPAELKASKMPEYASSVVKPHHRHVPAAFSIMDNLPKGVTDEVLATTQCDAAWTGVASVQVDHAGRVQNADVARVAASNACKRALNVLIRSSLANDVTLSSAFTNDSIVLAHAGAVDSCFDESDVRDSGDETPLRVGGDVKPPRKIRSVEPMYPEESRKARDQGIIIVEARINANGCVGGMQILKALTPPLNMASLLAISQWRFAPGTLNEKPVDVLFNLTISFKLK